ncbi:hypothetical protein Hanom_Chr08g00692791 [Helianthus anomalus]
MNLEQGGPSCVNENQNNDQWGILGLENMTAISNFDGNQNFDLEDPDFWALNRISNLITVDVNNVDVDNQIYTGNVQHQTNNEPVGTQNNQSVYTTPASHTLTFFPDSQTDYNYFAPNQSQEDIMPNIQM